MRFIPAVSPVQIQSPLPCSLRCRASQGTPFQTHGPLVKWLRHGPFTAVTWVRFPYGSPCRHPKGRRQFGGLAQLVRAPASHAGGHWFESSSLHQKVPDFVRNQELFLFMISKVTRYFGVFRLTQTVTQKPRGQESTGEGRMASSVPLRLFFVGYMVWLMTLPMVSAAERFIPSVAWV